MTFKVADRVRETTQTTGVGEYIRDGAPTGFQPFSAMGAGNTAPYLATDNINWEVGIGTILGSSERLARTTILASSNAGAAVNWGAGSKDLICTLPANLAVILDAAGGPGVTSAYMRTVLASVDETEARTAIGALPNDGSVLITVPAGATGAQVPQAQEVVGKTGAQTMDGPLTVTGAVTAGINSLVKGDGAANGGSLLLEKPATGSTLAGNVDVAIVGDLLKIFEAGGAGRGAQLDLSTLLASAGSVLDVISSGGSGASRWVQFGNGLKIQTATTGALPDAVGQQAHNITFPIAFTSQVWLVIPVLLTTLSGSNGPWGVTLQWHSANTLLTTAQVNSTEEIARTQSNWEIGILAIGI